MYSGEDSSGDTINNKNQFGSWPLGAAGSMNNEHIDWAALAQQWIQMKGSCPAISAEQRNTPANLTTNYEEQGEAPMEVVKDDETPSTQMPPNNNTDCVPQSFSSSREWTAGSWYPNQAQFCTNWNNWNTDSSLRQVPGVPTLNFFKDNQNSVPLIKTGSQSQTVDVPPMDAAKKKILPAWIREGLEKMEKEKQRQLEREGKVYVDGSSGMGINADSTIKETLNDIQKVIENLDSEDDSKEDTVTLEVNTSQKPTERSHEEIVEEMMLSVRRTLTELLLEVTTEEIASVAQETLRKFKTKASSAQVFRKSAISSITGKLGLGAYADSASENSETESDNSGNDNDSEDELRETIRVKQSAFKSIAQEIELSLAQPEERDHHEKDKGQSSKEVIETSVQGYYDKDSGEKQPDKRNQSNGKRSKERTSRFSTLKDCKQKNNSYILHQTATSSSSGIEPDTKRKLKVPRRNSHSSNSSSDQYESYRYSSSSSKNKRYKSYKDDRHRRAGSKDSNSDDQYKKRKHNSYKSKSKDRSRSRSRTHSYSSNRRH